MIACRLKAIHCCTAAHVECSACCMHAALPECLNSLCAAHTLQMCHDVLQHAQTDPKAFSLSGPAAWAMQHNALHTAAAACHS
jgi:hypothetical protein